MNLLLPVVVLWGTLIAGFDRPTAVVGTVERGSPGRSAPACCRATASSPSTASRCAGGTRSRTRCASARPGTSRSRSSGRLPAPPRRSALRVELDVASRPGLDVLPRQPRRRLARPPARAPEGRARHHRRRVAGRARRASLRRPRRGRRGPGARGLERLRAAPTRRRARRGKRRAPRRARPADAEADPRARGAGPRQRSTRWA